MNIRHAETKDGWGIANVRVNSWKTTYRGFYPDDKLDELNPEDDKDKWSRIADECLKSPFKQLLVAENGGFGLLNQMNILDILTIAGAIFLSQLIIAITVSLIITKNSISTKKDSKKKSKK